MTGGRVEDLLRDCAPRVLATLVRRHGQFDACEDAVQEALLAAVRQWPLDGVPGRPHAWLLTVAGRALVDRWRGDMARRRREAAAALDPTEQAPTADRDDTLALLFLCCHPALSPPSQLALTLRAVGGLTTAEIAAALLVPEATSASGSAGPSTPSVAPERGSSCRTARFAPTGSPSSCTCSTSSSTRDTPPAPDPYCNAQT